MKLQDWIDNNAPNEGMRWRTAAEQQFRGMVRLWPNASVVGTHTSKSITLPVVEILGTQGRFLLRDNFYDVNLCCIWDFPPELPLEDIYPEQNWDWYLGKIKIKRESTMCYGHWTDDEMGDPRVLRVHVPGKTGGYWSTVTGDAKDRWLNRLTDTSWYGQDWSSGEILVAGPMGPGCRLFVARHSYAEGIADVVGSDALKPYRPGQSRFTLSISNLEDAARIMQQISTAKELL